MAKMVGTIEVDTEHCKGCVLCVVACPTKVLEMAHEVNSKGDHFSYMARPDDFIGCESCAQVCPDSVIEVWRAKVS